MNWRTAVVWAVIALGVVTTVATCTIITTHL